ncbi:MAG: alpha/beta fold hydrolase [Deferribacterales bacterium]
MSRKPNYKLTRYPDLSNVPVDELVLLDYKRSVSEGVKVSENYPFYKKGVNRIGVLLIHGFTASPYEMRELANFLNSKGYSVYNSRIVGHGSKSEYLDKLSFKDWYDSLKYGYFTLKNSCDKIIVIGQSMGGLLAVNISKYNKVDGLVLLAPSFKILDKRFPFVSIVQYFIDSVDKEYSETSKLNDYYYDKRSVKGMVNLKYLMGYTWSNGIDIKIPLLIIHSKYDDVVDINGSKSFFEIYEGKKEFFVIEDEKVKHILSSSLNPRKDVVFEKILEWLEAYNVKK